MRFYYIACSFPPFLKFTETPGTICNHDEGGGGEWGEGALYLYSLSPGENHGNLDIA